MPVLDNLHTSADIALLTSAVGVLMCTEIKILQPFQACWSRKDTNGKLRQPTATNGNLRQLFSIFAH